MNKQVSPFAALTGAEKQIRWLEYQSIQLPYVDTAIDPEPQQSYKTVGKHSQSLEMSKERRPEPPPEIPRTLPSDYQKSRHGQYDAVIARLKQAELQSRISSSHSAQQGQ